MRLSRKQTYPAAYFASLLFLLALSAEAVAQSTPAQTPGAAPAGCDSPEMQPHSTSQVKLSSDRGWQMEGRDINVTITSPNVTDKLTPLVCFRWKLRNGKGEYVQADPVRIVQRPTSGPQPGILTLTAAVPYPERKSPGAAGFYTPDNAAPIAEVRILLLDADRKVADDIVTTVAIVSANDYCNVPSPGFRTDSGTAESSAHKNWQPAGGEIEFTAKTSKTIPSDALIKTCFRWKLTQGDPGKLSDSPSIRVVERHPNLLKLAVTVPDIPNPPPRAWEFRADAQRVGSYAIAGLLVPQADVRVLIFDGDLNPVVDAPTIVGVTSVVFAVIMALLTLAIAFVGLWVVSRRRFPTLKKTNPLLFLITTRRGFASLSQFQIILWTFVVVASAAYVMALAGDLIPITTGTLVLLGISGAATVIAKAKGENDAAAAPAPLDPAAAAADAARAEDVAREAQVAAALPNATDDDRLGAQEEAAKAEAARAKAEAAEASGAAARARSAIATAVDKAQAEASARAAEVEAEAKRKAAAIAAAKAAVLTRIRHPRWSDLVMEEMQGRELDVTRIQMLYFTLVTAVFVILKVLTSYEIPAIPEGYLLLMGISNSVYVGSKFATNPAAKT